MQVPSDLSLRVAATDPGIVLKAPHSQLSLNSTSTHPSPTAGECATGYTNNALPSNLQKQMIAGAHTYSRFSKAMAVAGPVLHYDRAVIAFSLSASAPSSSSGASLFSKGCNQAPQRVDGDEDKDVDDVIAFFADASMCTPAQTAFQRPIRQVRGCEGKGGDVHT